MKIFIDFDDVIFNTKKFSQKLKNFFAENGVNEELYSKYYYEPNDSNEIRLFDPEGLFERLEKNEQIDTKEIRKNFNLLLNDLTKFVFDDVEEFLNFAGRENVYLVSFGQPLFQNKKIIGAEIDRMVNGCIVTKGSKAEAISKVMDELEIDQGEKIVFIDDRIEQIQDIKKNHPNARTFFLSRKEGRYCDKKNEYCDYEVHDLKEVQLIIKSKNICAE